MDYTNLIFALRNELKSETNRLNVLNERNKELDNIIKNQKAHLEKVQANIENEIRKRKNVERKVGKKNIKFNARQCHSLTFQCLNLQFLVRVKYSSSLSSSRNKHRVNYYINVNLAGGPQ